MRSHADRDATESRDPVAGERRARPWRDALERQLGVSGFTLSGFLVVEAVCTGALVTAILVAAL